MNKYSHLDYHQSLISEIHEESLKHLFTETLVVKSNVDTDQVKVKSFSRLASIVIEGRGRKRMVAQETSSGLEPGRMIISDARSVSTILLYDSDERGGQKMSTNDGAEPAAERSHVPSARLDNNATNAHHERTIVYRSPRSEVHRPTSTVARSRRAIVLSPMRRTEFFGRHNCIRTGPFD